MRDVPIRHFPKLAGALAKSENAPAPWTKLPGSAKYGGIEANCPEAELLDYSTVT